MKARSAGKICAHIIDGESKLNHHINARMSCVAQIKIQSFDPMTSDSATVLLVLFAWIWYTALRFIFVACEHISLSLSLSLYFIYSLLSGKMAGRLMIVNKTHYIEKCFWKQRENKRYDWISVSNVHLMNSALRKRM